jgi:hypothetical protein
MKKWWNKSRACLAGLFWISALARFVNRERGRLPSPSPERKVAEGFLGVQRVQSTTGH